jgi:hypothetical protein
VRGFDDGRCHGKALGLQVPDVVRLRADEVIE